MLVVVAGSNYYLLSMKVKLKMQLKSDMVKSAKLRFTFEKKID